MKNKRLLAHLGLLLVNMIYGANYLIAKGLMPNKLQPSGFILIRVVSAAIIFQIIRLIWKHPLITNKKDLARAAVCGLFGVALNQLLFFNGLSIGSPINASVIMVSNPVLVLLLGALILGERVTLRRASGMFIGVAACVAFILFGNSAQLKGSLAGDVMVFFNAISYGIYLILAKPLMSKYSPLTVISTVFFFGSLYVIPVGFTQFTAVDWSLFTTANYWALAYVVFAVTVLTYILNLFSLKHVSPSVTSSYIFLQPLVSSLVVFIAVSFNWSENYLEFTWPKLIFAFLIFIGVYMVSKPVKPIKNT